MAHGTHAHVDVELRIRRALALVATVAAIAVVIGLVVLRPTGKGRPDLGQLGQTGQFYDGRVVEIAESCESVPEDMDLACRTLTVRLLEGPDRDVRVDLEFPESASTPKLDVGDTIVLSHDANAQEGFEYRFADRQRKPTLFWLGALFAVAVVVLGRLRGIAALAGLAASLVVLLGFALPAIIDGRSPVAVAIVAAAAISFLALYLAHGLTTMTTVALLGTLGSLVLTAVLAVVFVELAEFSGLASEESTFLAAAAGSIDLRGLLLAGVVIGALGAVDDMTVTQASAVWELRAANPALAGSALYSAAFRIGRDHVASTVNTLVLAYAGASMPLLVLFVLSEQSLTSVANSEVVAVEIVRTLVGSIGLVASVPLTTWLAAVAVGRRAEAGRRTDVIHHLALRDRWDATTADYRWSSIDSTLEAEGFIHCSFPDQVERTARKYYAGRDDVLLLTIDPSLVPSEIKVENGYPHIYGPLPRDAVIRVEPFPT